VQKEKKKKKKIDFFFFFFLFFQLSQWKIHVAVGFLFSAGWYEPTKTSIALLTFEFLGLVTVAVAIAFMLALSFW
jgi:hypothetical protein